MSAQYPLRPWSETIHEHPFVLPEPRPELCVYAAEFSKWVGEQLVEALQYPTLIKIAQTKLLVLDQFFQYRTTAPKRHRTLMSNGMDGRGHRCLWAVFEDAYLQLRRAELKLSPPQLYVPEPTTSSAVSSNLVPGIYIGEEVS